jgi:PPOX class probable F420-dependent enzyme
MPRRLPAALQDSGLVDDQRLRQRFVSSPVASLATVRPDGGPHVVPVVFALVGETIFVAVDHKPKRSPDLQRLVNARHEPRCSVLVDHYDDDWSALWWVRADGHAEVVDHPAVDHPGLHALARRYHQYATTPPTGAVLAITVDRWSGWSSGA